MALMVAIFASIWSLTHTAEQTFATPAAEAAAAMSPHDMMKNAGEMPVHVIVDAI
jgi:hypothetical protein